MRRFFLLILLLLALPACDGTAFFPAPVDGGAGPDELLYDEGKAAYDAGDFSTALLSFEDLWANWPQSDRHPKAGYLRGRCRHALLRYAEAIAAFEELRAVHPASAWEDDALYYTGRSRFELLQFAAAAQEFARVEAEHPLSKRVDGARYRQGRSWYAALAYAQAIPPLEGVAPAGKFGERAAYRLGKSHYRLGQLDAALADFERVLAYPAAPHADDALYYEVRILADQGQCGLAAAKRDVLAASYPSSTRTTDAESYLQSACGL